MLFNSILTSTLIGLSTAAPFAKPPTPQFHPGGNFAWKPVNPQQDSKSPSKRVGATTLAVGGAVLGGVVGPVVTRAFNSVFGVQKKKRSDEDPDESDVDIDIAGLSWEEAKKLFVQTSVNAIFEADEGSDADAAVCVGVGYSVADPSKTVDEASFRFQADGEVEEYDCFILEGPTTFTVPANTSDSEVAVKFGGNGSFTGGVLTIN
ncbi:hypothetical protein Slin15195_G023550 [Septoria linicola]|uniref:DUF7888 domain-containing protein n=1 Tax=Septoria linicola TaxID=215465 RepID=A0A9Q9EEQ1_9PEZI|nr:hypothetical protein Slin14017_G022630 [Septoria linicola]USW49036.1 hypothetical protein Slin15195_G023550 [Septoria linicola]